MISYYNANYPKAIRDIIDQLRISTQKSSNLSKFNAHYERN